MATASLYKDECLGGLNADTYAAVNGLRAEAVLGVSSPAPLLKEIFQAIAAAPDEFSACKVNYLTPRNSLQDAKQQLVENTMHEARISVEGSVPVTRLISQLFDVLCAAYHLSDQDLPQIQSLYIHLGIALIPYSGHAKYERIHYEHHEIGSQTCAVHNTSFALTTFPFGTDCLSQEVYDFQRHLGGGNVDRRDVKHETTAEAAWSRISGFVPHGAPLMPANYDEALSYVARSAYPDIAELAITPHGIWRVVAHAGVRFKELYLQRAYRGPLNGAGEAVAPETLRAVAPTLYQKLHA